MPSPAMNPRAPLFERRLYWKILPKVLLFVPAVWLFFYLAYGLVTAADVFGTLAAAAINCLPDPL